MKSVSMTKSQLQAARLTQPPRIRQLSGFSPLPQLQYKNSRQACSSSYSLNAHFTLPAAASHTGFGLCSLLATESKIGLCSLQKAIKRINNLFVDDLEQMFQCTRKRNLLCLLLLFHVLVLVQGRFLVILCAL